MKNKNLLIGGAVLLGIILYLRSRNKSNEADTRSADAEGSAGGGLGSAGGGAMAKENGGGAVMATSQPVVVAQPKKQPPTMTPSLFNKPINVGGTTIKPSTPSNVATGIMAGKNTGFKPTGIMSSGNTGGNNFLTFDGGIDRPSDLDFGGQIID